MKTPIRYAGGKSKAYHTITSFLPILPYPKRIVSPFIGGGSLESQWASGLEINILGFDVFYPLVNFWQQLLKNSSELHGFLSQLSPTREEYYRIKEILIGWNETQNLLRDWHTNYYVRKPVELNEIDSAAYYFYNHNLSYGPMYLGWISKIYQNEKTWQRMIDKIKNYHNPLLEVQHGNFEDILPDFNHDFLYLDPPYYLEKDADNKMFKGIYPNANFDVHHSGFNHEKLRDLLHNHKGGFILSYNNCKTVRDYYQDFEFHFPKWHYSYALGETRIGKNKAEIGNTPKESHEILIVKRV